MDRLEAVDPEWFIPQEFTSYPVQNDSKFKLVEQTKQRSGWSYGETLARYHSVSQAVQAAHDAHTCAYMKNKEKKLRYRVRCPKVWLDRFNEAMVRLELVEQEIAELMEAGKHESE